MYPARAAISVDLDSLPHYCRIQGLSEALLDERARTLVEEVAVPRYLELFQAVGCPATFFCIGEDVERSPALASVLRKAHHAGVEIASHSHSHDYALSRAAPEQVLADLKRADEVLTRAIGQRPLGFRAPGYTLSPALLSAVAALGYSYDSSTFPAAPYYLAKASVMGVLASLGRPSRAVLDTPAVLAAPRVPYRPALEAPYRRGHAPFLELPISVSPALRMPFIGTVAVSLPWSVVKATWASLKQDTLINFELHAVDVLDASDGIPAALVRQQRDLKIPAGEKMKRLKTIFAGLHAERRSCTLAQAAAELGPLTES